MRASASAVPTESRRRRSRDLAWIFLAVFAAYATAIPGDFVWLDHVEIEQGGYRIVAGSDWLRVWTLPLDRYLHRDSGLTEVGGGYWRPVYAISLSLDWGLWGERAWLYHLENILWHLLVVFGLYALGRRLLARHPSGGRIAFWAALLFAVHPLGVHSVTWISGRKDLMCAAFGVASLLAFFETLSDRGVPAGGGRHRPVLGIALAAALLVLSVGSKELGFLVPLAATVLLPWIPMSHDPLNPRSARRRRLMSLGATRVQKTRGMRSGKRVAEYASVQAAIAEACAAVDAGRLMFLRDLEETHAAAEAGQPITLETRFRNRLTHGYLIKLAVAAIDGLYDVTGVGGLNMDSPVARAWRDIHAISHHVTLNWNIVSTMCGQHMLGLDPQGHY